MQPTRCFGAVRPQNRINPRACLPMTADPVGDTGAQLAKQSR
jgi:hypothetical protein